jgi:hypothetical protein
MKRNIYLRLTEIDLDYDCRIVPALDLDQDVLCQIYCHPSLHMLLDYILVRCMHLRCQDQHSAQPIICVTDMSTDLGREAQITTRTPLVILQDISSYNLRG